MEYKDLYEIWRDEISSGELQVLPKEFYSELTEYVRRITSGARMLDEDTVKAKLVKRESENVKKMVKDLLNSRFRKMFEGVFYGKPINEEALTEGEKKIYSEIYSVKENLESLIKRVLEGKYRVEEKVKERKYILLRFLKDVPAIVGSDMRTYGPFKPEDLATLPIENARILIKQGVAIEVETR